MAPHQAIVPTSTMMDFYVGGGIDYAFLGVGEAGLKNPRKTSGPLHSALIDPGFFQWIGLRENLQKNQGFPVKIFPSSSSMIFGQADACGNVNVSNFAGRVPGVGGFADPRRVTFWSKFGEKLQPYTNQVLLLLLSNYQIIKLSSSSTTSTSTSSTSSPPLNLRDQKSTPSDKYGDWLHNINSQHYYQHQFSFSIILYTHMAMDQYLYIPFLEGWTSINPSYFDVNRRGTIGFDPLPYVGFSVRHLNHQILRYPPRIKRGNGQYLHRTRIILSPLHLRPGHFRQCEDADLHGHLDLRQLSHQGGTEAAEGRDPYTGRVKLYIISYI